MTTLRCFLVSALCLAAVGDAWSKDVRAADVERDLKLEVILLGGSVHEAGTPLRVDLRLRNASATEAYPVVDPRGGMCQTPGTEPHIWFTAETDPGDGRWREVEKRELGMCGMGDFAWHGRVTRLRHGETLDIRNLNDVTLFLDVQGAGHLRLVAHYAFGQPTDVRLPGAETAKGPMKGVEPFELVSAPVLIEVVRPIEIDAKVTSALEIGAARPVSELAEATLENRGDTVLEAAAGTWHVYVMWRAKDGVLRMKSEYEQTEPRPLRLEPGGSMVVIGKTGLIKDVVTLEARPPGAVEMAVALETTVGTVRRLYSAWRTIDVK